MGILEKLEEKEKTTSKKGAFYYKFNKERYERLKKNGFYFNLDVN
jgi:8-oxo-dGTP diphosphatase